MGQKLDEKKITECPYDCLYQSSLKILYRKLDHLPPAQNDTEGKNKRFIQ